MLFPSPAMPPATIRTGSNRFFSLNYGLKNRGRGWDSVDVNRQAELKIINFYNHLRHSLDITRCPQKVEMERVKGIDSSTQYVD